MALKARRKSSAPSLSEFDLSGMLFSGNASQDKPLKVKRAKPSPASLLFSSAPSIPEDTDLGYYVKAENLTPGMTHGLDYAPTYPGAEILSVSENLGGRVKVRYSSPNRGDGREGIAEAIIAADKYCFILRGKVRTSAAPISGKRPVGRPRKVQPTQAGISPASLLFGSDPSQEKTAKVSPASLLFG